MSQLSLFESSETVFVDDGSGRIAYMPRFVPADIAHAWFAELRHAVSWKAERRRMYDRDVDVPRLTAHFLLAPEDRGLPPAILAAARHVIEKTGVAFNSVGLNLYRSGRDSVAPHNDHLYAIVEGFPIALLSLGATRRMTIRAKPLAPQDAPSRSDGARRTFHVPLETGSLLMMSYETQLHYTHGVPKTAETVGERISLAFRVKPAEGSYYT
jgi:alkylated DNA repair dioxygenase AlkB